MSDLSTGWRAAGSCLSADPDLFFPIATGPAAMKQITMARQVCAGCRVQQECLDWAMRMPEAHGIWGGTTPEERIRARRARTAQLRRTARPSLAQGSPRAPLASRTHGWPGAPSIRAS